MRNKPLILKLSSAYKKDLRKAESRGWDIDNKLLPLLAQLIIGKPLPRQCGDHQLSGKWRGYREFHAEPDWIVIYRKTDAFLIMARTGTHSELFKK